MKKKIIGILVCTLLIATAIPGIMAVSETKDQYSFPSVMDQEKSSSGQPPEVEWSNTYGESEFDWLFCIQETNDEGYIACGLREESNVYYAWLLKLDSEGIEEWNITNYEINGTDPSNTVMTSSVKQTDDGGYLVCGFGEHYVEEWPEILTVGVLWKVDGSGTTEWIKRYYDAVEEFMTIPWNVEEVDDGYIAAGIIAFDMVDYDAMLMKTNSTGVMEWQEIYRNGEYQDMAASFCSTNGDGYLLAGYTEDETGDWDYWMIKTDENGEKEWDKTYGGPEDEIGYSRRCFQTSDGGYIICGWTEGSYGAGSGDLWIVKTDADGNEDWNETFGGENRDPCWCMDSTDDGGYIFVVTFNFGSFAGDRDDIHIIKTDGDGNAQWSLVFGGPDSQIGQYISKTSDGGYIVCGRTKPSMTDPNCDGLVVKIGPDEEMETPEMQLRRPKAGWIYLFDLFGLPILITPNALVLGDLTFKAKADDASGIDKVEFFIDGLLVGETNETQGFFDTYNYKWTGAEKGTYNLKIRAYNNYGGTAKEVLTIQKVL